MPSSPNRNTPKKRSSNPRVVPILKSLAEVAYHRAQAADGVPLVSIANTPVETSARYVRQLSKDLCKEKMSHLRIKNMMRHGPTGIFRVANLPPKIDPVQFYPSKVELHKEQAFGKNNPCKSYSVKPVVSNIAVVLWKSGLLDVKDSNNLAAILPNGQTTLALLTKLRRTNFSALQLQPFDYNIHDSSEEETMINDLKKELCNACLLHYDMDLGVVQQYCGGRWTGEHRQTNQMLRVMSHILPEELFLELGAAMIDGVPNLLNTELPSEEVASLLATPNLTYSGEESRASGQGNPRGGTQPPIYGL